MTQSKAAIFVNALILGAILLVCIPVAVVGPLGTPSKTQTSSAASYAAPILTLDGLIFRARLDPAFVQSGFEESVLSLGVPSAAALTQQLTALASTNLGRPLARALARMQKERALPALLALAESKDKNPEYHKTAAHGLAAVRSKDALKALVKLLDDPEFEVQLETVECIGILQSADARLGVRDEIVQLFGRAKSDSLRMRAADCLVRFGGRESTDALAGGLFDASNDVRAASADALGRIGIKDDRSAGKLVELLCDLDTNIVRQSAIACGRLRIPDACPRLIELLRGSDEGLRADALWSLRCISNYQFPGTPERWREWWETEGKRAEAK
ncbi:MAG: HEAT repeat domain-containing protein [Planctomycetes bacterium]|nr:HEAT repeat domain-containing protein [Planctomycetota bacterium]